MNEYGRIRNLLRKEPKRWLITGVAGFIGSNLLEHLLGLDQIVVGIDNFSTGKSGNLAEVRDLVSPKQWGRFTFIDGDIRQLPVCQQGCKGAARRLLGYDPTHTLDQGLNAALEWYMRSVV